MATETLPNGVKTVYSYDNIDQIINLTYTKAKLGLAVINRDLDIVKILLESGANPNRGVSFDMDNINNVEVPYIARRGVAILPVFKYLLWKSVVQRLPAGDSYSLLGSPNCVTWTVEASLIAYALSKQ
jgi:hypothetical protein